MQIETILWLGEDYSDYTAAYYQQDLFQTVREHYEVLPYGDGFGNYDTDDDIDDIRAKVDGEPDLIVVSNTWGTEAQSIDEYSPHGRLGLERLDTPTLMFLNKEYAKLERKLEFIRRNDIDYVTSVLRDRCDEWEAETGATFIWQPFGIDLDRFEYDPTAPDTYDFGFSGNLHERWLDEREELKEHIFEPRYMDFSWWHNFVHTRRFKDRYDEFTIYWGERQNRSLRLRSRAPHGESYYSLLNRCKTFLNTPSALGIVNTRFWELMATKTLVICPEDDYFGLLTNGENCVMYEDLAEFDELLEYYVTHNDARRDIVENAAEFVTQFSWETIVSDLMTTIDSAESG
jgi:hypothetical protein